MAESLAALWDHEWLLAPVSPLVHDEVLALAEDLSAVSRGKQLLPGVHMLVDGEGRWPGELLPAHDA